MIDPACGSGNFLTESYIALRKIENEVLEMKMEVEKGQVAGQIMLGDLSGIESPIKVSIGQFYGIEINDFAVTVAKTALWIAESQMMKATEDIIHLDLDFLPLKSYANIVEGNALRMDWNDVISKDELDYIMGNPPFVGNSRLSDEQKAERDAIFDGAGGELDYVSCWYKKAAEYSFETNILCAFVSTNSICQGQQVAPLWKPLFDMGMHIDFAYKTFIWDSEASIKAHVYCIIIGFSYTGKMPRRIYEEDSCLEVEYINGYLMPTQNMFIEKRKNPINEEAPIVIKGFQPTDNGFLILDDIEKDTLLLKEPEAAKWIKPFITAREYIHQKNRWCIWLVSASPTDIKQIPLVYQRVLAVKEWREQQKKTGDAYKLKDVPQLMRKNNRFKEEDFIVLPRVTGERRRYIPFGFVEAGAIPADSIMLALGADKYHFGVLCSNVHMAWMRTVAGRLKGDYRYSSDIVYNNFPWPNVDVATREKIEKTARNILEARALYPNSSLADLYDPVLMPIELRKAHQANDRAVMQAYGFNVKETSEADCVSALMKMYQELVE